MQEQCLNIDDYDDDIEINNSLSISINLVSDLSINLVNTRLIN